MQLTVSKTELEEIRVLRVLFLQENNFQFVYDKCHYYGWADTYLFKAVDEKIGYGAVWGKDKREDRDAIFEFYILKPFRSMADTIFEQFQTFCGAPFIECQSNDLLLSSMLFRYSHNIAAEALLFEDHTQTNLMMPGAVLRINEEKTNNADKQYVLEHNGESVASGGLMLNYNMPYADIYMDVMEPFRQKGYGSFIVQELKKAAYLMGRVPAARCNTQNLASKKTLMKAGLSICGFRLNGTFVTATNS